MQRDQASLLDIWQAAQKIVMFSQGLDRELLRTNQEKQSAIHGPGHCYRRSR